MLQYKQLVEKIVNTGSVVPDRTGTGTKKIFGHQMRFDLQQGFPLVTLKKTFFKGVVVELLWMLRGETNIAWLKDQGVNIWDEWADQNGDLGPVYGAQWRGYQGITHSNDSESAQDFTLVIVDQLAELINNLNKDPFSRRHVVSAWNPAELPLAGVSPQTNAAMGKMALAPCHCLVQFDVAPDPHGGRPVLSCQLYQRSADVFLGVPFNIASYALLTEMLAYHLGYRAGELIWTGGDCHLYSNHAEQVQEMLQREPLPLPQLMFEYPPCTPLWEVDPKWVKAADYRYHNAISAPVAV